MDIIVDYQEVFESLRRNERWHTDKNILRFAALTLVGSEPGDPGKRVRTIATRLRKESGAFSPLASDLRHAVAAILLRRGFNPLAIVREVERTLALFKKHKLRKGGAHPFLAALLLVMQAQGSRVSEGSVARLTEIVRRWAEDHFFLTGVDDYPMAALHATRSVSIEQLAVDVELIYQLLRQARFSRGNQLQLVSHLLAFSSHRPHKAVERFQAMAEELRKRGQRIWQSQYDEVALLVLGGARLDRAAARTIELRDRLREFRPRPRASIAFSIASGLVLAEQLKKVEGLEGASTAASLRSVQTVIEAQQAAMVAGIIVATTAATTAAAT